MPSCFILRGLPGSGKSYLADLLGHAVCSADNYFYKDGIYKFDPKKLNSAHKDCVNDFQYYIYMRRNVIVDNTNLAKREYDHYVEYATYHGYDVTILTVETVLTDEQLAKRNTHGVPVETIKRMRARMYAKV